MKLNLIPPGEFAMGSPEQEAYHQTDETQHLVKITKPFYLSVHEVTQAQYERVMGNNPSDSNGPTKPVEQVSWQDAVEFCRKLSDEEGVEYRLPTEPEWEHACRGGTTTAYSFEGDASQLSKYAWFNANSGDTTHAVGEKLPNAWGLYDMHGNVIEWFQDRYARYETLRVVSDSTGGMSLKRRMLRGGAFDSLPRDVRAAFRYNRHLGPPGDRVGNNGFRLARTYDLSP